MYPEVVAIVPTAQQDKGLTIAFQNAVAAAAAAGDPAPAPKTPGAFLAVQVTDILTRYANDNVVQVNAQRIVDSFSKATPAVQAQVVAILGVTINTDPIEGVPG